MSSDAHPTTAQGTPADERVGTKPATVPVKFTTPIRPMGAWHVIGPDQHPWRVVAALASAQKGCVGHDQLIALGFTEAQIQHALKTGRLHRLHHGVYELEGARREHAREAAALLTVWPGVTLCGLSVLAIAGAVPLDPTCPVDVAIVTPGRHSRSRPGIRVHRYADLTAKHVHITNGLAMTTVERALLDAADELSGDELVRAVDEALAKRLTSRTKIRETAERAIGRRGRKELLMLAEARRPSIEEKLWAERTALALIRQAGLSMPQTHVRLFGFDADMYFAEAGLVLEIDSLAWHGLIRQNFNRDRRRDRVHRQNGLEVVRVTADELKQTPLVFISDLSAVIARRRATRGQWAVEEPGVG